MPDPVLTRRLTESKLKSGIRILRRSVLMNP
jgi:hypothetical protein